MLYNKIAKALVVTLCMAAMLPGCTKNNDLPVEAGNNLRSLEAYIAAESNTSIFSAAYTRSGIKEDSDWMAGGPYTYFIPVDSAFIAQNMSLAVVNAMDKDALKKMLKYMIVKGRISSTTLAGFFRQTAATLAPERPILTKNYYGIYFNGIAMQEANINLGDAVAHKMKRVAFPPPNSTLEIIANTPELSIFNAVIRRAYNIPMDGNRPGIKLLFETNGKTVFAPTDEAFIRYGIPSKDSASRIKDTITLAALIRGQVFTGTINPGVIYDNTAYSYTVSDFKGGLILGSTGASVREDGLTLRAGVNYPDIRIVKTDLLATDGIIQEIDQVILR